jgi:16S rRNA (adenine1518-N6/adenine1519-N6)-dimethyltransferase
MAEPKKALGQHWLTDRLILTSIADCADLTNKDTVLEIGPGQGSLTSILLKKSGRVVAVEFDKELARKLPGQFPCKNLEVVSADILTFNLSKLPTDYKVVANIPYYITGKIINLLMAADNQPSLTVLLVQKEVAHRLVAMSGKMSILAISAQVFTEVNPGPIIPANIFTPPPKVDSQVVILKRRTKPLVEKTDQKHFFKIVKAGFSAKRKKLSSSLAGGLNIPKNQVVEMLRAANINIDARAETLTIADWCRLIEKL